MRSREHGRKRDIDEYVACLHDVVGALAAEKEAITRGEYEREEGILQVKELAFRRMESLEALERADLSGEVGRLFETVIAAQRENVMLMEAALRDAGGRMAALSRGRAAVKGYASGQAPGPACIDRTT